MEKRNAEPFWEVRRDDDNVEERKVAFWRREGEGEEKGKRGAEPEAFWGGANEVEKREAEPKAFWGGADEVEEREAEPKAFWEVRE